MGRGATHERRGRPKVVVIFVLVLSGWVQQFVRLFVISGTRVNSRRRKLDQTHVRISRQKRRKASHFGLTSIGFYQHNQQTLNRLPPNTHTQSHNQTRGKFAKICFHVAPIKLFRVSGSDAEGLLTGNRLPAT